MTTYRIKTPHVTVGVVVHDDVIIQAGPVFHWAVGKEFSTLRDYCQKQGWRVEPLPEHNHPLSIEYEGVLYEFLWKNNGIIRITRHTEEGSRDISYRELPSVVKEQL
jgi:hypothetical protein